MLFKAFEALAKAIETIDSGIRKVWNQYLRWPIQTFFFVLIIVLTALICIIEAVCEEVDQFLADIEKFLISVALLFMVGFTFTAYLSREFQWSFLKIDGGNIMTVVLMIWVGFLGASLATRQRKHLSVDATDRILSPAAAKLTKRFVAILAGVFCWKLSNFSVSAINTSLIENYPQPSLPLWDFLAQPLDVLGRFLLPAYEDHTLSLLCATVVLLGVVYVIRVAQNPIVIRTCRLLGSASLLYAGLSLISVMWTPDNKDGTPYIWGETLTSGKMTEQELVEEIQKVSDMVQEDDDDDEAAEDEPEEAMAVSAEELEQQMAGLSFLKKNNAAQPSTKPTEKETNTKTASKQAPTQGETNKNELKKPTHKSIEGLVGDNVDDSVADLVGDDDDDDSVADLVGDDDDDDSVADLVGDDDDEDSVADLVGDDDDDDSVADLVGDDDDDSVADLVGDDDDDSVADLVGDDDDDSVADLVGDDDDDDSAVGLKGDGGNKKEDKSVINSEQNQNSVTTDTPSTPEIKSSENATQEQPPNQENPNGPNTKQASSQEPQNISQQDLDFFKKGLGDKKFPLWLAQSIIPVSLILMALRFFGLGLTGRFSREEDDVEGENISQPKPQMKWLRSTGRGSRDLLFTGLFPGMLIGISAALGMSTGGLIFMAAILLILVGSPLFLVIGVVTVACVTIVKQYPPDIVISDMYDAVSKEELLAIPFFVLAGNLMTQGAIAERLVGVARAVMGRTAGGLGLSAIFACVIFAAISGSSPVTVIAVGSIMFPMLIKERYPERYATGVLTSAGSLGIIIPPSVPMIIYAIMVSQTLIGVGEDMVGADGMLPGGWDACVLKEMTPNNLFIAGVLPGLFIALALAAYTLYQLRPSRKDIDIVVPEIEGGYWPNLLSNLKTSWLSLLLPILILGGIYGILGPLKFTVTEAAAVAVVYALFIELVIHREMKLKDLPKVLSDSGVMMGSLFLIIVLAVAFNYFMTVQEIPQTAVETIKEIVDNKWQFLILVNLFLLALGCFMDIISAILIVAPMLAPIAMAYGIHPLHFGIMFIVNLELGYLTPPLGINLFVSSTVFKRSVVDVMKATIPFLLLMLFCLLVIVLFQDLSLALISECN